MAEERVKLNRRLHRFARFLITPYLDRRYGLVGENSEMVNSLQSPFVVLPNHGNNWDPFFVHRFIDEPIYYIASDTFFRNPVLRWLMRQVGVVSKTKAIADFEAIKGILEIKRKKGIIGIFPEGQATWDGRNLPIIPGTAKLLKMLKLPVVVPLLKGAFLTRPRWKKYNRKGRITITYKMALTADEIRELSVEEIEARLNHHLSWDESAYQREAKLPFTGRDQAEYLESLLFTCPSCTSLCSMHSSGNSFTCDQCGYSVLYNMYGLLEQNSGDLKFDNIPEWNVWQVAHLAENIKTNTEKYRQTPIFVDENVRVMTGYRASKVKKYGFGMMSLFTDRLVFTPYVPKGENGTLEFKIDEIEGLNIQSGERPEFYKDHTMYRFQFPDKRISAFKWLTAIKLMHGESPIKSE